MSFMKTSGVRLIGIFKLLAGSGYSELPATEGQQLKQICYGCSVPGDCGKMISGAASRNASVMVADVGGMGGFRPDLRRRCAFSRGAFVRRTNQIRSGCVCICTERAAFDPAPRAPKTFEDCFSSAVQRVGRSGKRFAEPLVFELH